MTGMSGGRGSDGRQSDSTLILKAEPVGFHDGLDVCEMRNQE